MGSPPSRGLIQELELCIQLTHRVRDEVQAGRLDAMEETIAERGRRMDQIRQQLDARTGKDPLVSEALDRLKAENQSLLHWMAAEKSLTLGSLSSLREERDDPYRERLVGSTILDRTV